MSANPFIPDSFIRHITPQLPQNTSLEAFIAASQIPLRKSIRVNTLKISIVEFKQLADEYQWMLTPIPWCEAGFWIETEQDETSLGNHPAHISGLFYIQEASSMLPVTALFPQGLDLKLTVLDMAAAPGSKTTQIASLMNNSGLLIANEYSSSRVKILHANLLRCGVHNAAISHYDAQVFGEWLPETFDAILLDAPCSGEGTIRKDPDALKNWSLDALHSISSTQKTLIESAFHALKPGGELVYSTCTLSREENQDVCEHLLATFGDSVTKLPLTGLFTGSDAALTTEGYLHVFPEYFDSEGFFVAKFKKLHAIEPPPSTAKKPRRFPFNQASKRDILALESALLNDLDITIPDDRTVWLRDKEIWLFPSDISPILPKFKFSRIGTKLAEIHKHGYRWQHEAITALSTGSESSVITLDDQDLVNEWLMGRDIRPDIPNGGKGEVIVKYETMVLGIGKWVGNRIKNGLPRDLVKNKVSF